MDFTDLVKDLLKSPLSYLDCECPLALGAFMNGYGCADAGAEWLLKHLEDSFEGPSNASAYTKVFLRYSGRKGLEVLLGETQSLITKYGEPTAKPGSMAGTRFLSTVVDVIEQGRPGMMLGEPTVSWLANCWNGFLLGTERIDSDLAAEQRSTASGFERWISKRYAEPGSPWHGIVRVYEGPCEKGLRKFADLWRAFISARDGKPSL